jgi:hypothetical protein
VIWGVLHVRAQQSIRSTSGIDEPLVLVSKRMSVRLFLCKITCVRAPFEGIHSSASCGLSLDNAREPATKTETILQFLVRVSAIA